MRDRPRQRDGERDDGSERDDAAANAEPKLRSRRESPCGRLLELGKAVAGRYRGVRGASLSRRLGGSVGNCGRRAWGDSEADEVLSGVKPIHAPLVSESTSRKTALSDAILTARAAGQNRRWGRYTVRSLISSFGTPGSSLRANPNRKLLPHTKLLVAIRFLVAQ